MKIDINENIAKLIHSNETLKNDLISIGFIGLDNPLMIKNMANKMSIKRGAKLLGISEIESKLESLGYEVIDSSLDNDVIERQKLIKSYIRRLSDGENIENVRKDSPFCGESFLAFLNMKFYDFLFFSFTKLIELYQFDFK